MIKTSNMIFVFGSNLAGAHGAGAALYARNNRGAQMGIGVGRTGQCYAIPTKNYQIITMKLHEIETFVREFMDYTAENTQYCFQVTCIGCGLAGLKHSDIASMFQRYFADHSTEGGAKAFPNVYFDELWKPYLCPNANFWGTF